MNKLSPSFLRQTMISTISRDLGRTVTKSRRNELEDLRYGLSNNETLKLNVLCISLTLKARKIREKLVFGFSLPFYSPLCGKLQTLPLSLQTRFISSKIPCSPHELPYLSCPKNFVPQCPAWVYTDPMETNPFLLPHLQKRERSQLKTSVNAQRLLNTVFFLVNTLFISFTFPPFLMPLADCQY